MKWFKDLKISKKLIAMSLSVAVITALVCAVGLTGIISITNSDKELYKYNTMSLNYSGSAAVNLQQLRYNILKLTTLASDDPATEKYTADVKLLRSTISDLILKCDEVMIFPRTQEMLDDINVKWAEYNTNIDAYYNTLNTEGVAAANDLVFNTLAPIGIELRDDFLTVFNQVSEEAAAKADMNNTLSQSATIIMIAIGVAGIIFSLIIGGYISRLIGRPITKIVNAADKLAIGDVDISIDVAASKDEIGSLASTFGKLVNSVKEQAYAAQRVAEGDLTVDVDIRSDSDVLGKSLSELVSNLHELAEKIVTASNQVSDGSNMVSNSSMALSQGATEQASAVEQLTASITEIATQTTQNAKNAEKANDLAKNAKTEASLGNDQMKEMLKAMDEINVSSSSINKIIKVIDDIAFQTNILALNAAVEAARAGAQGKGFAVVAEEVRSLAARSANAVKETTGLIEESIRKVDSGTKIARNTADALNRIANQVESAAELVGAIAAASNEQAAGIEQINSGLMQISQVVQTTAATSEESAAASEELSGQAAQLKNTVGIFNLRKGLTASQTGFSRQPSLPTRNPAARTAQAKAAPPIKARIELGGDDFGKY